MTMLSNILNALYPQDPEDDSYVTRLVVNGEEVINSDQQATFEDLTVTDTVVCDDIRNSAGESYSTNSSFGNIQFSGSVISTNNNTAIKITKDLIVGEDKFIVDAETGHTSTVGVITCNSNNTESFLLNTVPTDVVRSILIQNTNTATTAYRQVGLTFGISPTNAFGNSTGQGRCLFDMRLTRYNFSDSRLVFSSYNNLGTYRDIAFFDRNGSEFKNTIRSSFVMPTLSSGTTDPGDAARSIIIANEDDRTMGNIQSILSFIVSPGRVAGSGVNGGRCIFDLRMVRNTLSEGRLVFSTYDNTGAYSDLITFSKALSTFNSPMRLNISTDALYASNSDPTDPPRAFFLTNTTTSTAANRQVILTFGITPSNSFGAIGARCLFDMKLVRNSGSNCSMVFSSYDNAGIYSDIAIFGKTASTLNSSLNLVGDFTTPLISQIGNQISFGVNETNKRGLLTVNHVADNLFVNNSDPGDSARLISIQNPVTANTVGLQTGLSFGLSPTNAIGEGVLGNRCIFDMRLARVSSSNAKMVFSTYSNATYTDITSFATDLTEIMTNLTVGTEKQRQGLFTVNYPSASAFAPSTDPGNLARTMGIINSNSSITTRNASILSFGITPQNAYGSSSGQGRCLFDMKLVRDSYSNSSMIFSSVDNTALYSDIVAFSKNSTTFYTPITSESRIYAPGFTSSGYNFANRNVPLNIGIDNAASGYVANTDPGDTRRVALFTHKNVGANQAINLGFDISPELPFTTTNSSRCLGDLRFYRAFANSSSGQFLFSGYNISNQYRDFFIIGTDSSFPNGSLTVGASTPAVLSSTGLLTIANTTASTAATSGCATFAGGIGVANNSYFGTTTPMGLLSNGRLTVANTTASSSTTSGCATFAGGIGVNGASVIREPTTIGRTTFRANNQTFYISEVTSNWHGFRFGAPSPNSPRVYFGDLDGNTVTNIYAGSYTPFSGCHVAKNVGPALTASDIGKLFKLDGTLHKPTEILNGYANGKLCDQDMSKAIYGIICDANYLDQDGNSNGEVMLLSVGEGGCLVHDDSGIVNIECGDILVSRADGYARKLEDSEYTLQTIKYVVARARETYNGPSPYLLHVTVECG